LSGHAVFGQQVFGFVRFVKDDEAIVGRAAGPFYYLLEARGEFAFGWFLFFWLLTSCML
jgi:hypothetical protein